MSERWYTSLADSAVNETVRLIQCDLAKHSKWFENCVAEGRGVKAVRAKKKLSNQLEAITSIFVHKFSQAFWRGDGGLYAAREQGTTCDTMVDVAKKYLDEFATWQRAHEWNDLHLNDLAIRISCHTCSVWLSNDPDYWSSVDLNTFLKYERRLSHENTISVTQQVFEQLDWYSGEFRGNNVEVLLGDSPPESWFIYYSSSEKQRQAMTNAIDWMIKNFDARIDTSITAESQLFSLGDSVVLLMSASPDDSLDIELKSNTGEVTYPFDPRIQSEWAQLEADVLREITVTDVDGRKQVHDLEKASPLELRFPLKDFPLARIEYAPLRYSKTRSFLSLVAQDQQFRSLLASQGVDYPPDAPRRPGILGTHLVVVAETEAAAPLVIIAQRTARQDKRIGFHSGLWSVSLEEQVALSDGNLQETALRALREELLGPRAAETEVKTIALFLERPILNLTGAVVCRTSMTFDEIHRLWRSTDDRAEHSQIIGLPLTLQNVQECIKYAEIPETIRRQCKVHPDFQSVFDQTDPKLGWKLHPTSALRLALAYYTIAYPD